MKDGVSPYLTFSGNCREAMMFYQQCIGGELHFQTVQESPLGHKLPDNMKDSILHAKLTRGNLLLMASDMVDDIGLKPGNSISLVLHCHSKKEIRDYYRKLSKDGEKTQPLEITFFGSMMGGLRDKYGNNWLLNCQVDE
jgi:PhnB protein